MQTSFYLSKSSYTAWPGTVTPPCIYCQLLFEEGSKVCPPSRLSLHRSSIPVSRGMENESVFSPFVLRRWRLLLFSRYRLFFFSKHRGYVSRASRAAEKDGGGVKDEREQDQGHRLEDYWARVDVFTATNVEKRIFS